MNKKALQVKMSLFTGIIATVLLVGCQNTKPAETISSQLNDLAVVNETQHGIDAFAETEVQKDNTDGGYKILYGKWVVEKEIGESYRLGTEDISDMLRKTFVFSRKKCMFYYDNEEVQIDYPNYDITIIPLDEKTMYFPYMPTMKEIGITGNYVSIFSVMADYDIYYILKDDDTLVMFYKNVYLELKRIEHEEGYKSNYHAF